MFEKIIKFKTSKVYLDNSSIRPEPSKLNIPKWYKDLEHSQNHRTIKGCMPFLDTLTSGYLLRMPLDYRIRHNIDYKGERTSEGGSLLHINNKLVNETNLNTGYDESHPIDQLGMQCPFIQKNKTLQVHKILNPWIIETPPNYSCLFLPPMNNGDDRFSIIPGIVDTDMFPNEINFPFLVNGDKYPVLDSIIKKGTPYVQVIPFRRDNWKLKIEVEKKEKKVRHPLWSTDFLYRYKNKFWKKKSWK